MTTDIHVCAESLVSFGEEGLGGLIRGLSARGLIWLSPFQRCADSKRTCIPASEHLDQARLDTLFEVISEITKRDVFHAESDRNLIAMEMYGFGMAAEDIHHEGPQRKRQG